MCESITAWCLIKDVGTAVCLRVKVGHFSEMVCVYDAAQVVRHPLYCLRSGSWSQQVCSGYRCMLEG